MTIDLSKLPDNTNKKYIPFYKNKNRYLILYGSAASGKSFFSAQKIVYRMLVEGNHRFLIIRKVASTLRHSVFRSISDLISDWKLTAYFKINKTEMTITCEHTKSSILFLGLDDREKIKSIAGITSVFIEEATELNEEDFSQIDLRLRGETDNYKQIILCFNPISVTNWVKKHWFDEPKKDALVVKTTYLDNRYIDAQYKEVLEALRESNYDLYRVYALGDFGVLKGVIYPKFTIISQMPNGCDDEGIGVDFGYTDPTAGIRCMIIGKNLYLDELIYDTELITSDIIKMLPENTHIYCDAAEPDRIQEMNRAGLWAEKGIKDVVAGINRVKSFEIFITARSVSTIRDLQTYSWKNDRDGNPLDVPNHLNSHAPDAIRYAVHSITQNKLNTQSFTLKGL